MGSIKNILPEYIISHIDGGNILSEFLRGFETEFPNFGIHSVSIKDHSYTQPGKIEFTLDFENDEMIDDFTSFATPCGSVRFKCEDIISFDKVENEIKYSPDWMYEIEFNKIEAYGQIIGVWFQFRIENGSNILGIAAKKIKVLNIDRNIFD